MCGRFTRYLAWPEIVRLYRLTLDFEIGKNTPPAYNIAPTEDVLFVTAGEDGGHERWLETAPSVRPAASRLRDIDELLQVLSHRRGAFLV